MSDSARDNLVAAAWQGAVWTAAVAAAFSVVVAAVLVASHVKGRVLDPRDSLIVAELKKELAQDARNEKLKERIRALDHELRRDYFRRSAFATRGAWLLAAGIVVFVLAARTAADLRRKLPAPEGPLHERGAEARRGAVTRRAVAVAGIVLGAAALLLAAVPRSGLPSRAVPDPDDTPAVAKAPPYPSADEMARNWPRFRGPGGLGIAREAGVPTAWNGKTGEGIVWKTPVPLHAPNSPVVWGDHVFLSGATKDKREVYCFDARTGKLLWTGAVAGIRGSPAEPPEVMKDAGHAAATVATDGRRVYAIFANGDLAAFDVAGKRVWAKSLGKPDNGYGHSSSLLTWRDRLIVLMDQGEEDDDRSKLIAFDGATGAIVWRVIRKTGSTWGTPIVAATPSGPQIITVSVPWVVAYDAATGAELWRADCMDGEVAPSPAYADGHVFVAQAYAIAAAIRTDGKGDVTKSHIVWRAEDGLPDTCSPLTDGTLLFLATAEGMVTCYEARTGEKLWEHDYETHFLASPTLVGGTVHLASDKGVTYIFAAAREFKELARAELGERVLASPAFHGGRIYVRGRKHLFCIGKTPGAKQPDAKP